jgi:hypothetical protein
MKIREELEQLEWLSKLILYWQEVGPIPAAIFCVMPHAVLVRFKMGDKEEVAAFLPGRMFVNGTDNLLKFGKTPELLAAILDTQLDIKASFVLELPYMLVSEARVVVSRLHFHLEFELSFVLVERSQSWWPL